MAILDRITLKNIFKPGAKPTAAVFANWMDSFWHKNDPINLDQVKGLTEELNNKISTEDKTQILTALKKQEDTWNELKDQTVLKYNDAEQTVASDVIRLVDANTGENVNYRETTTWYDGSAMDDSKVDGITAVKYGDKYYTRIFTEIHSEWFNHVGNDDDVLEQAIKFAAVTKSKLVLEGRTFINARQKLFENISDFTIDAQKNTLLLSTDKRFNSYFLMFKNCGRLTIKNLSFDFNQPNLPVYQKTDYDAAPGNISTIYNSGIYLLSCYDFIIENCKFSNLYNKAVVFYGAYGIVNIINNEFFSRKQSQNQMMEHLNIWQSSANIMISSNKFINEIPNNPANGVCAIFGFSCGNYGSVKVLNNYFEGCGRNNDGTHRLYAIDFYDDVNNCIIDSNIFRKTTWGAIRFDGTRENFTISNNHIEQLYSDDSGIINSTPRRVTGGFNNIKIIGNIISSLDPSKQAIGILLQNPYQSFNGKNFTISNNICRDLKVFTSIIGNISNYSIIGNSGSVNKGIEITSTSESDYGNSTLLGSSIISNNNFKGATGVDILVSYPTNYCRPFIITANSFESNTVDGISVVVGGTISGKVQIMGNTIKNALYGLYIRTQGVYCGNNFFFEVTNPFLEDFPAIKEINYSNMIKL